MSIVSYCQRPVCTATPNETLLAAAQRMEKDGVGLLVVTEQEHLVGVLTDRDVALYVAAGGHDAASARIADVMSRSPVAVKTDVPLEEALALLRDRRLRRLPVVDRVGRIEGVVSADDLVRLLSREVAALGEVLAAQLPPGASGAVGPELPQESPRRTAEHYGRDVATSSPSASIAEITRDMQERAIGSVVVLDEVGKAVGLVTDRDVALRVVAAGLAPATTAASAIMSTPLITADPSDPLEEVVERMRSAGVRRVPILHDGRPVGIVTFDDLLVAFGSELDQLGACVSEEIRTARTRSQRERFRHDLEERVDEAVTQLRHLGDRTLRTLGSELNRVVDRVVGSIRGTGARAGEPAELRVADLMQTDVRSCTPEDALSEAARIMWERDCGCVPVVARDASGRVVGMITDRDICMAAYASGGRLAEMQVKGAMSARVHSCRAEAPVSEAEHIMQSNQVRRLPVVDAVGRLRGIVSLADVAEAAAGLRVAAGRVSDAEVAHTLEAICRPRSAVDRPKA